SSDVCSSDLCVLRRPWLRRRRDSRRVVNAQALATSACTPPAAGKAPTALRPVQSSRYRRERVRPTYRRMVNAQALATSVCTPPAAGKAPTALRPVQSSVSTRARVRPAYRRVVNAQALATLMRTPPAAGPTGLQAGNAVILPQRGQQRVEAFQAALVVGLG